MSKKAKPIDLAYGASDAEFNAFLDGVLDRMLDAELDGEKDHTITVSRRFFKRLHKSNLIDYIPVPKGYRGKLHHYPTFIGRRIRVPGSVYAD